MGVRKIYCGYCGVRTDEKFCVECGQRTEKFKKFCNRCGEELESSVKKCPNCGRCIRFSVSNVILSAALMILLTALGIYYKPSPLAAIFILSAMILTLLLCTKWIDRKYREYPERRYIVKIGCIVLILICILASTVICHLPPNRFNVNWIIKREMYRDTWQNMKEDYEGYESVGVYMQTHELIDSGDAYWVNLETFYSARRGRIEYPRIEFDNQYFRLDKRSGKTESITKERYKDAKLLPRSHTLASKVPYLEEQYAKEVERRWEKREKEWKKEEKEKEK